MKQWEHGADGYQIAKKYGVPKEKLIDFSSNITFYVSEKLEEMLPRALHEAMQYPDCSYMHLRQALGAYLEIPKEWVIPGNGASELISLCAAILKGPVLLVQPTFSEYEKALKLAGVATKPFVLDKEKAFALEEHLLQKEAMDCQAIWLCNPNNPTGQVMVLEKIVDFVKKQDKLLIVDETFMDYVPKREKVSLVKKLFETKNIIIIQAVTKFFGLPGLRLGYLLTSNEKIREEIRKRQMPWSVNSFANVLVPMMLEDTMYQESVRAYYIAERKRMKQELSKLRTIKVYDSYANFFLLELKKGSASAIKEWLIQHHHILIRDASNFLGLNQNFIRIAVKDEANNEKLLEALNKWEKIGENS